MVIAWVNLRRLVAGLLVLIVATGILALRRAPDAPPVVQAILVAPTAPPALTFVAPTAAPTAPITTNPAPYPIYGPAAELRDDVWLNTAAPLRLADLRGQVVLLLFWSFDCIPCRPTLSNVGAWYTAYTAQGLTVIGVHFPKVEEERSYDNLAAALARLSIPYPVAQDNDGLIWSAYGAGVWPTITLIDRRGYLRYQQVGAGSYDQTETAIRALLAESS